MNSVPLKKVLIIDDSLLDRTILKEVLKDDYQVLETGDGQGVLDMIAQNIPDIILLDIQMPGMDGFEVCRRLKSDDKYRFIPVFFFTASTDLESKVKGFQSGAVDYITKPFINEEIRARIKVHLRIKELEEQRLKRLEEERRKVEEDNRQMTQQLKSADQQLKDFTIQMIQSEKMAAIGEITAGIAHELNQPLNVTKIICQSIAKDIEKNRFDLEGAKEDLPEIISQMNRMAKIIDHIRGFAKYTPGKAMEELNINTVIDNVFIFFGQQLSNHNIGVEKNFTDNLPMITGDSVRLEQVFLNIITNARQAMEAANKPSKTIEIKSYLDPDRKNIVVEFKDNGPGVPCEIQDKIFEAFFTTKEPGIGTGLGLSFAKKIIEEHGGQIEVESQPGEWTTFRLTFPAIVQI
ncbi:MAG: response regulator [Candidatus Omnitrophica bacterium]|nr:response regulator [Candidatus Omnitrophota bacterium]